MLVSLSTSGREVKWREVTARCIIGPVSLSALSLGNLLSANPTNSSAVSVDDSGLNDRGESISLIQAKSQPSSASQISSNPF